MLQPLHRVQRRIRLHGDAGDGVRRLAQSPCYAGEGARRAESRDEVRNLPAGLLPDLGARSIKMGAPVGVVVVLVWVEVCARCVRDDLLDASLCAVGALHRVGQNQLGAECSERLLALLGGIGGESERHVEAASRPDHGVCNSRVAARRVDQCGVGREPARREAFLNHPQRGAILDGAARVHKLRLGEDRHRIRQVLADGIEV